MATRDVHRTPARVAAALAALSALAGSPCGAQSPEDSNAPRPAWYCPIDLEVIDTEATVAIALKAGDRPPLVVVHDTEVASRVTAAFESAFARTHEAFVARMQAVFGSTSIDAGVAGSAAFREFRAEFQASNPLFPVGPALGQTWARGFDAEPARERISAPLRVMERDHLIGEVRPASTVFVVAAGSVGHVRRWGEVAPRTRSIDPAEILTLAAAGERLRRMNDPLDRAADGFLSGLLRANVAEDSYLTGLLLRDRLGSAVVHQTIAQGTRLALGGEPVDNWARLALVQLGRAGIAPLDAPPALESPVEAPAAQATPEEVETPPSPMRWVLTGLSIGALIVVVCLFLVVFARRRRARPEVAAGTIVPTGPHDTTLAPAPRGWKDRLVRALFTQRSVLLANEQAASRRVEEMEERLARLQPAIAEKIRGYEQRIEALEKEIAERDVETRELLRAKLVLARKELEDEVARSRIRWN